MGFAGERRRFGDEVPRLIMASSSKSLCETFLLLVLGGVFPPSSPISPSLLSDSSRMDSAEDRASSP